ncbi:S-methyl-5'-thioinosine phosphorylase [Methylomonas koyamae]|uniref:Probable S-methyl-5'-thioinosine phosphorylase n=1 Tax=Methylomonas koyamae TaxID=702114 RepID=A0A291IKE4_9GAMM|nr:S-methyl-5'-thioinosine phosphorylase [Methylomonas koyamae]ATG90676.1 5''-methylthioadenosine phosphorylase [Methylomonas koyamae]OAI22251.1 5'-methylthioadenosine phosphorylase [Methylomonas koyamae]
MTLAIIGGTGLTQIEQLNITGQRELETPFGAPSAPYVLGELNGQSLIFLARHGNPHRIPPHKINYRANIWGLKQLGATEIIGVAAVGGIGAEMGPARIAIPEQLIDYSYGREHSFFADDLAHVTHIDFTEPYTPSLRRRIVQAAASAGIEVYDGGVYGCTQGPRLETVAEIKRMANDGCDLVGMTGMPEAALARELEIPYANISVVANWAAGIGEGEITMAEIEKNLLTGMSNAIALLQATVLSATGG